MFKKAMIFMTAGLLVMPASSYAVTAAEARNNMQQQRTTLTTEYDKLVKDGKATEKTSGIGKTLVNVAGAGIGAAVLGVGTAQIMKASNRSSFNAAQQAWMNEVGNHIRCYIGPDEVGMYSDIISTEME
jgi:hypothetical protein